MKVRATAVDDAGEIERIQVLTRQQASRRLVADADVDARSLDERAAMRRRRIGSRATTLLVADDGLTCGWIRIGPARDADALSAAGEVRALYVLPGSWNREAARALWSAARDRLVAGGMATATLWVFFDNAARAAAYERRRWRLDHDSDKTFDRAAGTMLEARSGIGLA